MATITFNGPFGALHHNQIGTCLSIPVVTLAGTTVADETSLVEGMTVEGVSVFAGAMDETLTTSRGALAFADKSGNAIIFAAKTSTPAAIKREALLIKYFTSNRGSVSTLHSVEAERFVDEKMVYSYEYTEEEIINSITSKVGVLALVQAILAAGDGGDFAPSDAMVADITAEAMVALDAENRVAKICNLMA